MVVLGELAVPNTPGEEIVENAVEEEWLTIDLAIGKQNDLLLRSVQILGHFGDDRSPLMVCRNRLALEDIVQHVLKPCAVKHRLRGRFLLAVEGGQEVIPSILPLKRP